MNVEHEGVDNKEQAATSAYAQARQRCCADLTVSAWLQRRRGRPVVWILDMWKPRQGRVNADQSGKRESSPSCPVPQSITLVRTRPVHDTTATSRRENRLCSAGQPPRRRRATRARRQQQLPRIPACGSRAAAPLHHRAVHCQSARYTPPTPVTHRHGNHSSTAHNDIATAARTCP
jgi:hypothetical protein